MLKALRILILASILLQMVAFSVSTTAVQDAVANTAASAENTCTGVYQHVSLPLNDLGNRVYIRMDGENTGEIGGLYPGGANQRPAAHTKAGIALAGQVAPLDINGKPDPENGKIVMISVGMSNTGAEFLRFIQNAQYDRDLNKQLVLVNGAQPNMTAPDWVDPQAPTWQVVNKHLAERKVSPLQVQVAWIKLTHVGTGPFPGWSQNLETDTGIGRTQP